MKETEALRTQVATLSTRDVVRTCAFYLLQRHSSDEAGRLISPSRQVMFLLGLLFATPDPSTPAQFTDWPQVRERLNRIFNAYLDMFYVGVDVKSEAWEAAKRVSAPAFLHYFNQGRLVSPQQHDLLFEKLLVPFDHRIKQAMGISASETLRVRKAIEVQLEEQSARVLAEVERRGLSIEKIRSSDREYGNGMSMQDLFGRVDDLLCVRLADLRSAVGLDLANVFWKQFTICRGATSPLTYLTDENEADYRPIFLLTPEVGICLNLNELYSAPYLAIERALAQGGDRRAFFDLRSDVLERRVVDAATAFFGSSARLLPSAYEVAATNEHDLIVLWQRRVFVFEAKSKPPTEPLRDPEKAFVRVRDDFRSDKGIQGAFDQATRIRARWRAGETIQLHDKTGAVVARIVPDDVDEMYSVCVTGDDFEPLAVDLSLLLEKDAGTPFPWAVNIHDLETLLRGWNHRGWGPAELCTYLDERSQLHGKIRSDDELDLSGYFLRHGSFRHVLDAKAEQVVLDLDYSSIFDEIDAAERDGPPVDFTITEPVVTDLRDSVWAAGTRPTDQHRVVPVKVGRNAQCPCGSGLKYKKCCGRPHSTDAATEAGLA
ncbi:MAG: SEC-C metal-binding domain-containing protein [Planctomycetota bacterium]